MWNCCGDGYTHFESSSDGDGGEDEEATEWLTGHADGPEGAEEEEEGGEGEDRGMEEIVLSNGKTDFWPGAAVEESWEGIWLRGLLLEEGTESEDWCIGHPAGGEPDVG